METTGDCSVWGFVQCGLHSVAGTAVPAAGARDCPGRNNKLPPCGSPSCSTREGKRTSRSGTVSGEFAGSRPALPATGQKQRGGQSQQPGDGYCEAWAGDGGQEPRYAQVGVAMVALLVIDHADRVRAMRSALRGRPDQPPWSGSDSQAGDRARPAGPWSGSDCYAGVSAFINAAAVSWSMHVGLPPLSEWYAPPLVLPVK